MSAEDLERYETEIELQLYKEYRDVLPMFAYVIETERRFYLANQVQLDVRNEGGGQLLPARAQRPASVRQRTTPPDGSPRRSRL
jgi:hypothetical protein